MMNKKEVSAYVVLHKRALKRAGSEGLDALRSFSLLCPSPYKARGIGDGGPAHTSEQSYKESLLISTDKSWV